MLKKTILTVAMLLTIGLAACAPAAAPQDSRSGLDGFGGGAPASTAAMVAVEREAAAEFASDSSIAVERLVIQNANLSLDVKDPAAAADEVARLARELGGFVVTSNVYQYSTDAQGNKIMQASVSLRVPAERLDEALARLKGLAVNVRSEGRSGEDVTAQYTDLESQLRNLEAAEAQLQKIMDGAVKTEDVLNVYNQLVSVRGQIEQVKGQMQYYRESAAMSFISVELIPDVLSQPIEVGGWKAEGVAREAIEALVRAFQWLGTAAIWLGIYCLPLGLLLGVPAWFGGRFILRRLRKSKPASNA